MQILDGKTSGKAFIVLLILLLSILCVLFRQSFDPSKVLFANDLPLGALQAEQSQLPGTLKGSWADSNWIGGESISAAPDVTAFFGSILSPVMMVKCYPPISMLLLGLCAWLCFRELGFRPIVCILGGLAAGLNMHALSFACWGLSHWVISLAMMFLAIAALVSKSIKRGWVRGILAGTAVGINLMEGFDVGAIDSLYVGAFGLFAGLVGEKISGRTIIKTIWVLGIVAVFAALTAAHTLLSLVGTQLQGTTLDQQNKMTKEERWLFVTQWSLPKKEVLRILIPGIFGYRMVDGENRYSEKSYWGTVAQSPGYEEQGENYHRGLARHSGSGEYSGIFVLFVAVLAIAQSFRKQNSPFTPLKKTHVRFWSIIALVSLLLAFGRHAPFFKVVFALPFISSIRNTLKHLNFFHISLLILFGYGLESMVRRYFDNPAAKTNVAKNFVSAFEKKWIVFSCVALGASVLSWMFYAGSKRKILTYLETHFPREIAPQIAEFSMGEAGWFVLFFAASVVLVLMILRGKFAGKLKLGGILMGALIAADLAHADVHWIVYYNYKEKYATNPVIDFLKEKPQEQRVMVFPFEVNDAMTFFQRNVYYTEWLQHHFYYYNIQTLDVPQEPRTAADNAAYRDAFRKAGVTGLVRMWQLSNVRYFFGLASGFVDSINQQIDPEQKRFKVRTPFSVAQETRGGGPYSVETNSTGPFALIEFTGALPRTKLYSNWQVITNDEATLQQLADPAFDPLKTVLVANAISSAITNSSTNLNAGTVQFASYHPKRIELVAKAEAPSVLLLNDKYNPNWKVFVDGQQKPLLRANYIMRGVQLDSGEHKIEFRFEPPLNALYVSLAALGVSLVVCAFVAFGRKGPEPVAEKT